MPFVTSSIDETQLYYSDYFPTKLDKSHAAGFEQEVSIALIFVHGWPMSGQMFHHLMLPLCEDHKLRCIAIDRRGFGKSDWQGRRPATITYDTFAMDTLNVLYQIPHLGDFIFVSASMGCGENILTYQLLMRDGQHQRCKGMVWLGPSLPFPLKSEAAPTAPSQEVWHSILKGLRDNRPAFVKASIGGVFGVPIGIEVDESALDHFMNLVSQADALAIERCIQIIIRKDFTDDIKHLNGQVQVLIIHGDSDQGMEKGHDTLINLMNAGMPMEASTMILKQLMPSANVRLYERAAHGLYWTHAKDVLKDIKQFVAEQLQS